MPSTYTTNGGIEKIATGEQSGSWGDTTNDNFDIIDRITNGVGSITLSGTSSNLQTADGALSDGQYKVLLLNGTLSATHTITVLPNDAQKLYFVQNNTAQSIIFDQGSGSNVTVSAGKNEILYCDGGGAGASVVSLLNALELPSYLETANNLSDLDSAVTALVNLGINATAAELNIMDGVTATTAEINILDGVTASAAELNYNDITTLGQSEASKVVTADANNVITITGQTADSVGTVSSGVVDLSTGNFFSDEPSANITYSFTNPIASGSVGAFVLKVTPSALIAITWPDSVVWSRGVTPNTTGSGEVDVFVFYTQDGGTTYYGFQAGDDMS